MRLNTQTRRDIRNVKAAAGRVTADPLEALGLVVMALVVAFCMLLPWLTD